MKIKKYFTIKLRKIQIRDLDLGKRKDLDLENKKRRKRSKNTKIGDVVVASLNL